jgi:hypothetical protein
MGEDMKYAIIMLALGIIFWGCQSSPTESEKFKSPRDMVWSVDTLYPLDGFQFIPQQLWGSSGADVFLVGYNTNRDILHFNGTEWEAMPFHERHGGTVSGAVYIERIFGLSSDDVWFGGFESYYTTFPAEDDSALIVHYDGVTFEKVPIHGRTEKGKKINNIWGSGPDDVWFAGCNNELYHWDGSSIRRVEPPFTIQRFGDDRLYTWVAGNSPSRVYVLFQNRPYLPDFSNVKSYYYYYNETEGWQKIFDTEEYYTMGGGFPWVSPEGTLYVTGLYKIVDSAPEYLTMGFTITGTSDNNLLVTGNPGEAPKHFNGVDWQEIEALKGYDNLSLAPIWFNEKEAFIGGDPFSGNQFYVFRGK